MGGTVERGLAAIVLFDLAGAARSVNALPAASRNASSTLHSRMNCIIEQGIAQRVPGRFSAQGFEPFSPLIAE